MKGWLRALILIGGTILLIWVASLLVNLLMGPPGGGK